MGKIRRAYALNDHDAEALMSALWPTGIFPWELWQKIYEKFWRGFADRNATLYRFESPAFPESTPAEEKYFFSHIYGHDITTLFKKLTSNVHENAIRLGLKELLELTYDDSSDVRFQIEIDSFLEKLAQIEKNSHYHFTMIDADAFFALMDEKILSITPAQYHFLSKLYSDTILVDTVAAIRHLDSINYPLREEVKGITQSLVGSIIKARKQKEPSVTETIPPQEEAAAQVPPQEQKKVILISTALWKGKSPVSIREAMRQLEYEDFVIAKVYFERCGITNMTQIGRLLGPTGQDPSSYLRLAKRLLSEAASWEIEDA